jgi:hypothetical protein
MLVALKVDCGFRLIVPLLVDITRVEFLLNLTLVLLVVVIRVVLVHKSSCN